MRKPNLQEANLFRIADLQEANLEEADLQGADLRNADLTGAINSNSQTITRKQKLYTRQNYLMGWRKDIKKEKLQTL